MATTAITPDQDVLGWIQAFVEEGKTVDTRPASVCRVITSQA
jgi:hypothetical protein